MADRFLTMARADRWLFPAAALWAALCVPLWLAGAMPAAPAWHGHALLFGFAPAVIGGFLYTRRHPFWPGALALAWLAGRLAALAPLRPFSPLVGVLYPVLLVGVLWPGLWGHAKRVENRIAPAVVALLAVLDAAWWGTMLAGRPAWALRCLSATLDVLALLLLVMGGRALRAALGGHLERQGRPRRDRPDRGNERRLAGLLGSALVCEGFDLKVSSGVLLVLAAGLALWRTRDWSLGCAREAVRLWTLAVGYLWIPAGLLVKACWLFGWLPGLMGIHALAVGALGTLTLVMMARTALLRARRPLEGLGDVGLGVGLVGGGALARLGADLVPAWREVLLWSAALGWSGAFLLLFVRLMRVEKSGSGHGGPFPET